MFHRVPVRFMSVALVAFATTLSLRAAARPSPSLNEVLARAAGATAAFADFSQRVVCQENDRQTTVIDPVPTPSALGLDEGPAHDRVEWAYRDIVASWSIAPPSRYGSDEWNEVRNVPSLGRFQPFPGKRAMDARSTALIDAIDLPAPFPRFAIMFLSAINQPHFEFSKVGETEVGGLTVWEVKFRETSTPSLWRLPLSGSFWLDPSTGRLVRSAIAVRGTAPFSDAMTVDYRVDPSTAFSLPRSLTRRTHVTSERSWVDTTGTFTGCRVLPASSH